MKSIDTSENYQNGVIKDNYTLFWIFWFNRIWFYKIAKKEEILKFLDSKRKSKTEDPEQKWITIVEWLSFAN